MTFGHFFIYIQADYGHNEEDAAARQQAASFFMSGRR